jgi:hypothetical protein
MKAISIDDCDYKPRKRRPSLKSHPVGKRSEFRLRDTATGLYLSRCNETRDIVPEFNASGRRWSTRAATEQVWAEFILAHLLQSTTPVPTLVMEEFEVTTTLKGEVDVTPVDPSPFLNFAAEAAPFHVCQTAKKLILRGFPFTHLVVLRPENIEDLLAAIPHTMTKMVSEIRLSHMYHGGGEPRRDEAIIAVTSAADMMVLHLTHYDDLAYVYDAQAVRTHVGPFEEH